LNTAADLLESELDKALCEAYHYRNARMLGQLAQARVQIILNIRGIYYDYFIEKGMKLGDIKRERMICKIEDAKKFIEKIGLKVI
jgi:hypothetical protein